MIDHTLLQGLALDPLGATFDRLGLVTANAPSSLSFLDKEGFVDALASNPNVSGVIVTPSLAPRLRELRSDLVLIFHEDPRWAYYSLHNALAVHQRQTWHSKIAEDASIHPSASIAANNVRIGARSVVGPQVAILEDVQIGEDCVIQAGTVIGGVGFEVKRTSKGLLSVIHDGEVRIGNRVEIGANTCIDKGFRENPTIIEDEARIDNLVHVAHGVHIGSRAFIVAGSVIGGSAVIGEDAWMSINASVAPSITVGEGAFVSMGGVVTRTVPAHTQVTGNFAIPHHQFLELFKQWLRSAKPADDK